MVTPRRLRLTEFAKCEAVTLSADELDGLRDQHPGLRVEPSRGLEGRFDLTPDQRIGLICLPTLTVEIRPKVPMASVVFLISYACGAAKWSDPEPEFGEDHDLSELLAILLAKVVERVTRRGLLSGYITEEETLRAPRGRIRFEDQLRLRLGRTPPVDVVHDVFTTDIVENRVLLAGLNVFRRARLRSEVARRELLRAKRAFGGVSELHFPPARVPEVRRTRLNSHYAPALELATLVLQSQSLDVGRGSGRASAFLVDMNVVFESFVRIALRETLRLDHRSFPDRVPHLHFDVAGRVRLKPDLCLVASERVVWVGDAKYKRLSSGAFQHADLYQMLAYLTALGLSHGMLVYAADAGVSSVDHDVLHVGKRLCVRALDLSSPRRALLSQLDSVAEQIRSTVSACHRGRKRSEWALSCIAR